MILDGVEQSTLTLLLVPPSVCHPDISAKSPASGLSFPKTAKFFALAIAQALQAAVVGKLPKYRAASRTDFPTVASAEKAMPKSTPPTMSEIIIGRIIAVSTMALPDEQRASREKNSTNEVI
jgi:hypothetical protein